MTVQLLLVEDDLPLAELTCAYLTKQGYQAHHVADIQSALKLNPPLPIDLIICDVMLPGRSGIAAFHELVQKFECPLLFLTALDGIDDQVAALQLGACDYIVKPVQPKLLTARIEANLRKNPLKQLQQSHLLTLGNVTLDRQLHTVTSGDTRWVVTTKEFDVLWVFARHLGQVLSREYLFEQVVGRPFDGLDRAVDSKVSRLRRLLQQQPLWGLELVTVHGKGYRLMKVDTKA